MANKHSSRSKRPTMRDVAEIAGVSVMTVSNVVNKRFEFVAEKTRARIERVIRDLNYHPNATSRRLRSSREFAVGMVIVDDNPAFLSDPFITELVTGISKHLAVNNYTLNLQGVMPDEVQDAAIFKTAGMDALCLISCGTAKIRQRNIDFVTSLGRPVVLLQETLDVQNADVAIVNQDDFSGGSMIAAHVLARNAKRLLLLVPSTEWPAIEERRRGMEAAVRDFGKNASLEVLVCEQEDFPQTQAALRKYLREFGSPDAILGSNDRFGIAAMRHLQTEGLRVPEDVQVTGFNGFESHQYTNPSLTTIMSPASEMGQYAAATVLRRLETGKFSKNRTLYPVMFQQGGSA